MKKNVLRDSWEAGVDWTPNLIVNSTHAQRSMLGAIGIGPVARLHPWRVPLTVRAGASVKAWNDSMAQGTGGFSSKAYDNDKGYYSAFELGDPEKPLFNLPLYVNARGYGRSMETAKLMAGQGSALLALGLPTGDSLFTLYADSLINGRDALLGQGLDGKTRYTNLPSRFEHSFQIKSGIKGKKRWVLNSGLVYGFSNYSIEYPSSQANMLSDRQNAVHSVNAMVSTEESFPLLYYGGMSVSWEKEDKLFKSAFGDTVNAAGSNTDSLRINNNDFVGFRAVMSHLLLLPLFKSGSLNYALDISRYSRTYPNFYRSGSDTVRNVDDNDWIVTRHYAEFTPASGPRGNVRLTGEYSINQRSYVRREKSADNSIDYLYRLGMSGVLVPHERLKIEGSALAEAKKTVYTFAQQRISMQLDPYPPPYSRRFSTRLSLDWNITSALTFKTEWGELYWDGGRWVDYRYVDSTMLAKDSSLANLHAYFGIERKSWDHSLRGSFILSIPGAVDCEAGAAFEDIYYQQFKGDAFVLDNLGSGYKLIPFATMTSVLNSRFKIRLKFTRHIDTVAEDYCDFSIFFIARL
jgi:hypothetical protein